MKKQITRTYTIVGGFHHKKTMMENYTYYDRTYCSFSVLTIKI
jgi:hypothetical protein